MDEMDNQKGEEGRRRTDWGVLARERHLIDQ